MYIAKLSVFWYKPRNEDRLPILAVALWSICTISLVSMLSVSYMLTSL